MADCCCENHLASMNKPTVIRRGQRVPYRKGTQAQIDERRGFVARLLVKGLTKTQIHRAVRERFNIQWRQCDRYLAFVASPNTRLARVRVKHRRIYQDEHFQKLCAIFSDAANA
jgi:hypothetical protein